MRDSKVRKWIVLILMGQVGGDGDDDGDGRDDGDVVVEVWWFEEGEVYRGITVSLWKLDGRMELVGEGERMELVEGVEVDVGFVGCVVVVVAVVLWGVERVRLLEEHY